MPLTLIAGPPNSGRTGKVIEAFRAAGAREPVLVVPTVDDVERFERELTGNGEVLVGASVCTFDRLFALVARRTGSPAGAALSRTQRRRLAAEAAARTDLALLAASSRRAGFAAALDELISELQAASIDPATFAERAAEAGPYEREVAALYASYVAVRRELEWEDDHSLALAATSALRAQPDSWEARPVLFYGFDDLTLEQLELVRELARATEVTFALPWEDREVLTAARGALRSELSEGGDVQVIELEAQPEFTASSTLFELERRFGEASADTPIDNDGGLTFLASAGELGEVEAVGTEVAHLLDAGVPAREIAIVLRDPASAGPLYRRVLSRFQIPVALQADLDVTRTLTGAGTVALLQAAVGRRLGSDLLAYLRTPGVASPRSVDWFERRMLRRRLRGPDEALAAWTEDGKRSLPGLEKLRAAGSGAELLREAGRQARWIAELAVKRRAEVAEEDRALELRAGAAIEGALFELAQLDLGHDPGEAIAAVEALSVPMWRGPTEGRVRVISPYRARARRVSHMFVASLQDGDFPRRDSGGPLLSDDARSALALPPRKQAEVEDRYLFSVCLSRPKQALWLSWRSADDEGGATARSPFVDEIRDLLSPALPDGLEQRDEAIAAEAGGRGLAESIFRQGEAPSERELLRAQAAAGGSELPLERLLPGPLRLDPVRELMGKVTLFGPSTIEDYAECPYRWFVNHELKPRQVGPDDEPLVAGSIAHKVLERLYETPPTPDKRPTRESLAAWIERARELIEEVGPKRLPRERSDTAAALHRIEGLVIAFLADEATTETGFVPERVEARFGFEDSEKPEGLAIGTGGLHGQIDRVDVGPGGEALVQDYKSGAKVEGGKGMLGRGKLQLQLYLLAARELWGLDLAGGLYRPLGGTSERQPKGLLRKSVSDDLEALDPRPGDRVSDEDFEQALSDAEAEAARIIGAIQSGQIGRDPIKNKCPDYCSYQPICRRERGLPEEEPAREDDEDDG